MCEKLIITKIIIKIVPKIIQIKHIAYFDGLNNRVNKNNYSINSTEMPSYFDISYHQQHRKLVDLVENRTAYTLDNAELNIYETHKTAEKVALQFSNPVLASMIRGKKVMHLTGLPSFAFLPGESVIVPSHEPMQIDFPEAREDNPTQCLALAISQPQIRKITDELNERFPLIDDSKGWSFTETNFYLTNDSGINQLVSHLVYIFTENNTAKDVFADLVLKELIIRLMQTKARTILLDNYQQNVHWNRLSFAVKYIHENIYKSISVKELSEKACMSEPNFYRCFKQQFGITPIEYINQKRIELAQKLLQTIDTNIADICFSCGFNNHNHFTKTFKKYTQTTPAHYRKRFVNDVLANKSRHLPLGYLLNSEAF